MHEIYAVTQSHSCCSTCEIGCYRFTSNPSMPAGDCFNITFSWSLQKSFTIAPATQCFCILCNGTIKASCAISAKAGTNCSGVLSSFTFIAGDTVEAEVKAEVPQISENSYAGVSINNVACISTKGCYCIGSPSLVCSTAGAVV